MKLDLVKRSAAVVTQLIDETVEQPFECDILLPDYCPDIVRVLTCRADADITGRSVNGSELTVDAMITVTVCYLGEVGGVRKTTVRQPFSKRFELGSASAEPVIFASAQRSSVSCRAVSKRRVDVRGSMQLSVSVFDAGNVDVICEAGNADLCLLRDEKLNECIAENAVSRFNIREEVSPVSGVENLSEIIRCECVPVLSEWRIVSGGILVKGELLVSMLASFEEEKLSLMKYSLPMSRLIEHRNGENVSDVSIRCPFVQCAAAEDGNGRISVEMQLEASVICSVKNTLTAACDAFSTRFAHRQDKTEISELSVYSQLKEKIKAEAKTSAPDMPDTVCDVCAGVSQLSCRAADGGMKITGRITFAALVMGTQGGVQAVSSSVLFEKNIALPADGVFDCKAEAAVVSADALIDGEGVKFDAEILVSGVILEKRSWAALGEISLDENTPIERDESVALIIRYADEGERIWDIASHYAVSPDDIISANSLESDVVTEAAVLIIPAPRT